MDRYHIALIVMFTVFLFSLGAYFNVLGLGTLLAGLGGGIVGGFAAFLTWGGAGGGPTVGVVISTWMILGFILGGLIMKGINQVRGQKTQALGPQQSSPQNVTPIGPMQSEPVQNQTPTPTPEQPVPQPVKKEEVAATV